MILIVDDTIEVAQLLVEVAKTTGYYADFALDGPSALYKIQKIYYSLIFIDIILPQMDGNELATKIKELPEPFCKIPLVAMTGAHEIKVARKLFIHRLQKPFLPRHVRSVIEKHANPPIKDLHLSYEARTAFINPGPQNGI
jgi:CheY-like chemotaxis protein